MLDTGLQGCQGWKRSSQKNCLYECKITMKLSAVVVGDTNLPAGWASSPVAVSERTQHRLSIAPTIHRSFCWWHDREPTGPSQAARPLLSFLLCADGDYQKGSSSSRPLTSLSPVLYLCLLRSGQRDLDPRSCTSTTRVRRTPTLHGKKLQMRHDKLCNARGDQPREPPMTSCCRRRRAHTQKSPGRE